MQEYLTTRIGTWLAVGAVLWGAVASAQERPGPDRSPRGRVVVIAQRAGEAGDYWLGLGCTPVEGALRAQLNLPKGQGLLVEDVVPKGPAADAGVQQYDILMKAGEKPLANVEDLLNAVSDARNRELSMELLRGGKKVSLTVTPAKRPEDATWMYRRSLPDRSEWEHRMLEYLEQFRPGADGRPPMRFDFYHPGTVLPPAEKPEGDDPGRAQGLTGRLERRMEEMAGRIEELRKSIDNLRDHRAAAKAAEQAKPQATPEESSKDIPQDTP